MKAGVLLAVLLTLLGSTVTSPTALAEPTPADFNPSGIPENQFLLEINNIRTFRELVDIKSNLRERLPENTRILERRVSRGLIVLALNTTAELLEIKDAVQRLPVGSNRFLNYLGTEDHSIRVEIK